MKKSSEINAMSFFPLAFLEKCNTKGHSWLNKQNAIANVELFEWVNHDLFLPMNKYKIATS